MNTRLSILCDKFIEACWLAALILAPLYMNIYTHRMFEADKVCVIRSLAILMLVFYLTKLIERKITFNSAVSVAQGTNTALYQEIRQQSSLEFSLFLRSPIFISFALFVIAYIVSVAISAAPYNSIWGNYDRLHGLYSSAAYWLIFILAALNLRTVTQVRRLINTVILVSIPVVAYAIIQKIGEDPIPWQQMNPADRPSSTMGNPNFFAAYLVIIIPITLTRFIFAVTTKTGIISRMLFGLALLLQISALVLTRSQEAMLAAILSIFACLLFYGFVNRKKVLFAVTAAIFALVLAFLILFNLPDLVTFGNPKPGNKISPAWQETFGRMRQISYLGDLGRIFETKSGSSGRTKVILWQSNWKLINSKDEPYRFYFGYGPETLSTISYKYYTMELAALEGANIHADRAHNMFLDIWIWHGLIGLIAFLLLIIAAFYIGLKTIYLCRDETGASDSDNLYLQLAIIGAISGIFAHLVQGFGGIDIAVTLAYFWILLAAIYAIYKIKILPPAQPELAAMLHVDATPRGTPPEANTIETLPSDLPIQPDQPILENPQPPLPDMPVKKSYISLYSFVAIMTITIIIALMLFSVFWPKAKLIDPDIRQRQDQLLSIFLLWLFVSFIIGTFVLWRYIFWIYIVQTLILIVVLVSRYWPSDLTNTDLLITYSWIWFLDGLIIGALSLNRSYRLIDLFIPNDDNAHQPPSQNTTDDLGQVKSGSFGGFMTGFVMLFVGFIFIINNLNLLRADGFYKFAFSYDTTTEEWLRKGNYDMAFRIRMDCIGYFQKLLSLNPTESAYLNGAGRNFLELAKLKTKLDETSNTIMESKISNPPEISEIVKMDLKKFDTFSNRDFLMCTVPCIKKAYELNPNNFERIVAMIRVYRYWGELDKDVTKFEKAWEFIKKARKASPLNNKIDDEEQEINRLIANIRKR